MTSDDPGPPDQPPGAPMHRLLRRLADDVRGSVGRERDEAAWQELLARLEALGRRLSPHAADADLADAVSTVLVRLLTNPDVLERVSASGSPNSYLFVMLRHAIIDQQRARGLDRVELAHALHPSSTSTPSAEAQLEAQFETDALLAHLTPDERTLLVWRFVEDLSIQEIAGRLETTPAAVYQRVFRTMAKLRRLSGASDGQAEELRQPGTDDWSP
jgi:RNA polymerase sigma-70 factor, ECF subfamily